MVGAHGQECKFDFGLSTIIMLPQDLVSDSSVGIMAVFRHGSDRKEWVMALRFPRSMVAVEERFAAESACRDYLFSVR